MQQNNSPIGSQTSSKRATMMKIKLLEAKK
jgi:hypothetical protein